MKLKFELVPILLHLRLIFIYLKINRKILHIKKIKSKISITLIIPYLMNKTLYIYIDLPAFLRRNLKVGPEGIFDRNFGDMMMITVERNCKWSMKFSRFIRVITMHQMMIVYFVLPEINYRYSSWFLYIYIYINVGRRQQKGRN